MRRRVNVGGRPPAYFGASDSKPSSLKLWITARTWSSDVNAILAIAGNLAGKKYVPPSLGTFPVTTPLFTLLLIGVILIVGALTFFPALSLGPILEHLLMATGKTF